MRRSLSPLIAFALSLNAFLSLANADDTTLKGAIWHKGDIRQGGLVTAQVPAGATVMLDDTPLPLSANHHIAFGFHRDDDKAQILTITTKDGTSYITTLFPEQRDYKTQTINGLASKYVSPPQEVLDRIARDRQKVATARAHLSYLDDFITNGFDWPASGTITGIYGSQRILNGTPRAPHYGIDIAAPAGTPVLAPADGIITMADDLYYTGGTIIIDHGLHISSTMLHLDMMTVSHGDKIKRGDVIGTIGSTGRSTGPHLDWRLNWGQKRLDPQLALVADEN
ncbi:MAG: M23 family metallopeptidase [Candidatus Puniceispirillaceae bacterium]